MVQLNGSGSTLNRFLDRTGSLQLFSVGADSLSLVLHWNRVSELLSGASKPAQSCIYCQKYVVIQQLLKHSLASQLYCWRTLYRPFYAISVYFFLQQLVCLSERFEVRFLRNGLQYML